MTRIRSVQTILFDLDGTLIDSNAAHADAWTRALVEHGVDVTVDQIRPLIGMGGDKLLPAVAGVEDSAERGQAITRRKKQLFDAALPSLRPTNGARALVETLRADAIDLVIATSADEKEMRALLEQAGVADFFPTRTTKDDASQSKPAPGIVHAALHRAGADPKTTLMIGDTPYDIEAAGRAGLQTIALRCGGHWRDVDLAAAIQTFEDPAALQLWWQQQRHRA